MKILKKTKQEEAVMKPRASHLRRTFLRPSHHSSSCLRFRDVSALGPQRSGKQKTQQDVCFDCHKATGINSHAPPSAATAAAVAQLHRKATLQSWIAASAPFI